MEMHVDASYTESTKTVLCEYDPCITPYTTCPVGGLKVVPLKTGRVGDGKV